jgi:hypothetical protein
LSIPVFSFVSSFTLLFIHSYFLSCILPCFLRLHPFLYSPL